MLCRRKWREFGRYVFYFQFIQYILFLISITGYTLTKLTFDSYQANIHSSGECPPELEVDNPAIIMVYRFLVFISVVLGVLIECSQIIRMKLRYCNISNMVDWTLYVLSIFFVLDLCLPFETVGCKGMQVS